MTTENSELPFNGIKPGKPKRTEETQGPVVAQVVAGAPKSASPPDVLGEMQKTLNQVSAAVCNKTPMRAAFDAALDNDVKTAREACKSDKEKLASRAEAGVRLNALIEDRESIGKRIFKRTAKTLAFVACGVAAGMVFRDKYREHKNEQGL